jgi:hypothetical protein
MVVSHSVVMLPRDFPASRKRRVKKTIPPVRFAVNSAGCERAGASPERFGSETDRTNASVSPSSAIAMRSIAREVAGRQPSDRVVVRQGQAFRKSAKSRWLSMTACVLEPTEALIREAFAEVDTQAVRDWQAAMLGASVPSRRRRDLNTTTCEKPAQDTNQTNPYISQRLNSPGPGLRCSFLACSSPPTLTRTISAIRMQLPPISRKLRRHLNLTSHQSPAKIAGGR